MRDRTLACLLLAVAAFGLPWQRCASDCHDRLLPAVGSHDCHDEPCEQDDSDADHERIELLSVPAPVAPVVLASPAIQGVSSDFARVLPTACAVWAPNTPPPDGEPATATVVLLI